MDKKLVLNIAERFRIELQSRGISIKKMILFGSYATENYHDASDIDIVVVSDDFEGMDFWERITVLSEAIFEIFEPIEAIAMTQQEWAAGDSPIAAYARNGEELTVSS